MKTDYRKDRVDHVVKYAEIHKFINYMGGTHKQTCHPHIIMVKKEYDDRKRKLIMDRNDQKDKIIKYNLIKGVKSDFLKSIHSMAHYLTSSQILCYNFFRPLIDAQRHPSNDLIQLLKNYHIEITKDAECEFEKRPSFKGKDGRKESSEVDFYIFDRTNSTEIFFEIKYTESSFGKWTKPKESVFKKFYEPLITKNQDLNRITIEYNGNFKSHFQLFRNMLFHKAQKNYTVFLFPKANLRLKKQFEQFHNYIQNKNTIQSWYWEDVVSTKHYSSIYEKYFA